MPSKGRCRLRAAIVIGALGAFAVAPSVAPAIAARGGVDQPEKGAIGSAPKGAIGVKGVSAASPGFAQATQPALGTESPPAASAEPTGLEARVGSLPFTGWDLIILGGVATVLAGTGFLLHRLSTPRIPYT